MQKLEEKLDDLLVKKAPYQLPESGKKTLVEFMPWLTLVGGILALLGVMGLYRLATLTESMASYTNGLNQAFGYSAAPMQPGLSVAIWLSLGLMAVEGVLYLMAFPALKARKKSGWSMLFGVALLNVAYAVVYMFYNQQISSFIFSLIGSVIGLYFLFQIRSYYGAGASKPVTTPTPPTASGSGTPPKQ